MSSRLGWSLIVAGYLFAIIGPILVISFGPALQGSDDAGFMLLLFILVAAGLMFFVGFMGVAAAKGYHFLVGLVLTLIGPLGLIILALIPERRAD